MPLDTTSPAVSPDDLLSHADPALREQGAFRSFLKQVADHLRPEDVEDVSTASLVKALSEFWHWTKTAEPREVRIRRLEPENPEAERARMLLETTGPDIPFLVDSLQADLSANGFDILATIHPIIGGEGGPQSHIQIHLAPLLASEGERAVRSARDTLSDVTLAVSDFNAMRQRMQDEAKKLVTLHHLDREAREEAYAFLTWLADNHFVFLGSRVYRFKRDDSGDFAREEPDMIEGSNLGLLRDEDRNILNASSEPTVLTPEISNFLREGSPLVIAKSNLFCRVHRRVYADYIGVKHYDEDGNVIGETRFAGLFTSEAYTESAHSIPLIRRKLDRVISRSDTVPGSHNAKALATILENHPRDELFQIGEDELLETALEILHLQGRPRTALFLRRDSFDRFVTAMLYVPRENYDASLRMRIGEHIRKAYDGEITGFYPKFGDENLARVHYNIALKPGHPEPDEAELKREVIRLSRTWEDRFRTAIEDSDLDDDALNAAICFRTAFTAGYREAFTPDEAITDVQEIAELFETAPVRVRAYRVDGEPDTSLHAKVYARGESLPLSRCVPVLENMGLFVHFETGYRVSPQDLPIEGAPKHYWIHTFSLSRADGQPVDLETVGDVFEQAFVSVWSGYSENDAFNKLVFAIGANWHEAALIRALSRYRRQTGLDPIETAQVAAFIKHADITRLLLDLFTTRFDPSDPCALDAREKRASDLRSQIEEHLKSVSALDEDRVLRRTADLIMAIQRTNYFQTDGDGRPFAHITFKIASQQLEALPEPKPFREIFVSSPRVEGVHLRFGPVARGGLRWSDRRDDFRTEVLGLVKAQQVKNAVIVPVGSKGGFYPKQLPAGGSREAVFEEGRSAYKLFIRSLLELTDNLEDGSVVHPGDTVIWDGEDPYLVVAADKGTATFSDTANAISIDHGFWLGDAFASGGSAGYDHKKMGITARGAWEAVKRHFREMGKNIQEEPFDVIGIGDMAGDVFGNGMLLSKKIRLIAAFNHMHVFVDPDPQDLDAAFAERKRLFEKDRSTWADYDTSLISQGGGVFSRAEKSVTLTDPIRKLTGLSGDAVTPDELIAALLRAPTDLLWFGGIGTFIKATTESHADVGDKANDGVRANAGEIRAKVIGEGANLGITQAGRIAFARAGGAVNTDAIDNSAGVDSSDHEVNIKILLTAAIANGSLKAEDRNALLASMTDDVAHHVLAHNYAQTSALTLAAASALSDHQAYERLMVHLEERGVLNRRVEGLPSTKQMQERENDDAPLTRPEISVLLAWSKIVLFDDIVASSVPDDPWLATILKDYFPDALDKFEDARSAHRLKREIIATVLSNRMLDRLGPATLQRLREASGASNAALVRGFVLAEEMLNSAGLEADIAALDNKVPADQQTAMRLELAYALFNLTSRFATEHSEEPITELVERFGPAFETFRARPDMLSTSYSEGRRDRRRKALVKAGVPEDVANRTTAVRPLIQGPLVIRLSEETGRDLDISAKVFTGAGDALALDRLRVAADDALQGMEFWDRVATRRFIADMMAQQVRLARAAFAACDEDDNDPVASWLKPREADRRSVVDGIRQKGQDGWTFAKFALAADDIRRFMDHGAGL